MSGAELRHRYSFTSDAADSIGSAHGVLQGGAAISGGAAQLDGNNDYVDLPNGIASTLTNATFETWLTDNGSGNWSRILDFGFSTAGEGASATGTNYLYVCPQTSGGFLRAGIIVNRLGGEQDVDWSGTRLPVGTPTHVVWTLDAPTRTGRLYVDGVQVGENTSLSLTPAQLGYTVNNWLGRSQYSADAYLKAGIDEFRVYSGALTAQEVQQNFSFGPDILAFDGPATLVTEPASQTVGELGSVTFTAASSGTPPVSAQWYRGPAAIPGATNWTYTTPSVSLADHHVGFRVMVSNNIAGMAHTDTSTNAVLTVTPDSTAPTLVRVSSLFPHGVRVEFSEGLRADTATNPANHVLTHAGGSLTVSAARFGDSASNLVLTTAEQTLNTRYTLTVNSVRDLAAAANPIATNSQASFFATPYTIDDIGSPSVLGGLTAVTGGFEATAGGSGIGGTSDQFTFTHETRIGDFDIQLRVARLDFTGAWARAGLLARNGLASNAVFAGCFATAGPAGCHFASRTTLGGSVTLAGSFPANSPYTWLRLRRTGNLFEGFGSWDGQTWQTLGWATFTMPPAMDVGLALSSGNPTTATTAQFLDVATGSGPVLRSLPLPVEPMGPCSRRTALVISEIMYDAPAAWSGTNSLEFVELWNSGLVTEDLTGHRLSGEIDYTFPAGTRIAPGEFLVVARDPAQAQACYGIPFLGPFTNKLANGGGTLRLLNELGGRLLEISYDNRAPWPAAPNGTGHSLVLTHPSYGENDARAWSASDVIGGSPGAADPFGPEPARGVVINEFLAHTDDPAVDFIELFNSQSQAVDLSGAWLSDAADSNKFRIPDGTTIPARGYLAFDQSQLGFALAADGEQLFLVNSNRTRVLDAIDFRGQANGVSSGRDPDGAPGFQELSSTTPGSANTPLLTRPLVINEIMYHPISESNEDEYLEIHNRTGSSVEVSDWRIQGGVSYQFPPGSVIGPNGYLVVAENRTNLLAQYPQLNATNTFGNYSGALNNRSDRVALAMPEDLISTNGLGIASTNIFHIVVDEVTYVDGGRWGRWSDGGGSSLELIDPNADNRLAANWADSDESTKAAWTMIDVTDELRNGQTYSDQGSYVVHPNRFEFFLQGAGEVLVDNLEFRNNGGGNLVGNADFSSGTSGWTLGGTLRSSFSENGVGIGGSAALHVVSTGRGDLGANKIARLMSSSVNTSAGSTGTIRAAVRWLKGSPHLLLRNSGNWIEVSQRLNVPSQCGTPGLPNSRKVANAGPAIRDVSHSPILPVAGEAVVVSARVSDPDGVSTVTLRFRADPSSSYSSMLLRDDGTGGDVWAGDGLYSATLPGRSSGSPVAFYLAATDGLAASAQFPQAAPVRECHVRWGEPVIPGGIGTYRLWVTAANISAWGNREKNANDPLDATFVYGDSRVVYNVDTLYSGSPFHTPSYNGPVGSFPPDYEINFPPGEQFLGSEPFVLTAYDASGSAFFLQDKSGQVDLTGNWVARKLGLPHDHRRHVHVVVNGQRRGTIYDDAQQPNSEYLDMYFSDDTNGQLRKIEDWFEFNDSQSTFGITTATLARHDNAGGEVDASRYRWNWRPRATPDPNDWFAFTNLIVAVDDTGAPDYESRVRTWMDLPHFLGPIVTHHLCGSWDSYGYRRGKNMFAYKPDPAGWRLLMWDIEMAMNYGGNSASDSIYNIHDSVLSGLITGTPAFHRVYLQGFQRALDTALAPGAAEAVLDERYASFQQNGVPMASPSGITAWLASRRTYLQGILPSAAFSVNGPSSFSAISNSVVLTGSAPLQVYEIRANDLPYPVTWTGTTTWSLRVPLQAGANALLITGVDRLGNVYPGASVSLNVTWTGSNVDPEGQMVINEIHPSPDVPGLQFVELYNTHADHTFDLSHWRLNGLGYTFPPGSILAPRKHLLLVEDPFAFSATQPAPIVFDAYGGSLDPEGETLTLFRPGLLPGEEIVVDRVRYEQAAPWPAATNGSSLQLVDATRDNSRVANWRSTADLPAQPPQNVIPITHSWRYYQSGNPGATWRDPGYNDTSWSGGPALLYVENASLPAPKSTPLTLGQMAYYFRTTFNYSGITAGAVLKLSTVVDDGAVVYLNGQEIHRLGMPAGTISHTTPASRVIGEAQYEGPFTIPASALVQGPNVLAAEVHQHASDSSDIVFGLTLDVTPGAATASSPGTANSLATSLPPFPQVWLNEVQVDNLTGPLDNFSEREPWVELYNAGTAPFNLAGYHLSDRYTNPTRWAFPAGATIPAGGFLLVWCDAEPGETAPGHLHADFELGSGSGRVALARITNGDPQIVDYLNYTNLPSNWSYGDVPDGQPFQRQAMFFHTASSTNRGASPPLTAVINEWLADNAAILADAADGGFEDWFEIHNPGTTSVDLGGYYLTDNLDDPFQFTIPNNGHYTIPPGGYLLVWADNEPGQNSTNRADLHVNFALGKGGESIGLFGGDGTAIDAVTFGAQTTDISEGRFPNGAANLCPMPTPTPRLPNVVPNTPPTLDPVADQALTVGQPLGFTAVARDADLPPQSLTFSLLSAPAGATLHPVSGRFNWTPVTAPSTNTLAVVVTDSGSPGLSATQTFSVIVVPPPAVSGVARLGNSVRFSWPSVSGLRYQVYYKDELREAFWNPTGTVLNGTGGLLSFTNSLGNTGTRFFCVGVMP